MKRKAFTIIELLMVIGVISVLITITSATVVGSVRSARKQQAIAICEMVKQGLHTYYAQKGKWPWGDIDPSMADSEDSGYYTLSEAQIRSAVFELVKEAKNNHNPMLDISGLYVSTSPGRPQTKVRGCDFMTAVRGSKQHPNKIKAGQLYFGYPETYHGYFRRFIIKYSPSNDDIVVRRFSEAEEEKGQSGLESSVGEEEESY